MKFKFKSLLTVVVAILALVALTFSASAQKYSPKTLVNSQTVYTNVAGSTASNVNYTITCTKQAKVGVYIKQNYDRAGTGETIYYFQRSVDGSNWDAVGMAGQAVGIAGTGNTAVPILTNLDTYGAGYMRIAWITNASAAAVNLTNLVIKYGEKINAP